MKERQRVRSMNLEDSTMSDELKIGFIGAGKMASALAGGLQQPAGATDGAHQRHPRAGSKPGR